MITFGDKKIKEIFQGNKNIVKVYAEINLVFPDVIPYDEEYLTVEIVDPGMGEFVFSSGYEGLKGTEIYYSLNGGNWTEINFSNGKIEGVRAGDKIRLKGTNNAYALSSSNYCNIGNGGTTPRPTFNLSGNIMSLIYGDDFKNKTSFPAESTYNFCSLFKQADVISAENLILPVMTMTESCYRAMFSKCASLTKAPVLPATTLATECYKYMFEECAITEAPELIATAVEANCYEAMFTKCIYLTTAPDLNISNLDKQNCYLRMFKGCSSLNYIKCLAQDRVSNNCTTEWMDGVSQNGTFVAYPGQTIFKETGQESQGTARGKDGIPTGWTIQHIEV